MSKDRIGFIDEKLANTLAGAPRLVIRSSTCMRTHTCAKVYRSKHTAGAVFDIYI